MMRLIGYELKKIFTRRILWAAMALGMILVGRECYTDLVPSRLNGQIQGMRDAYARYEGQVRTEPLADRARTELEAYIARHPDDFEANVWDDKDINPYHPRESGYASGLWYGYQQIFNGQTVEDQQAMRVRTEKAVQTGFEENGKPVSQKNMDRYIAYLAEDDVPPVILYTEGYDQLPIYTQFSGFPALLLILLMTVWIFPGERSARMEPVVLTARGRRRAALAKMAAAMLCGLLAFVIFFGIAVFFVGLTYGFHGFNASAGSGQTVGQVFVAYMALSLLAALAASSLTALLSAVVRHPMGALLGGGLAAAVQIIPYRIVSGFINIPSLQGLLNSEAGQRIQRIFLLLPATALWNSVDLPMWIRYQMSSVLPGLGLSAIIAALSLWLAPRLWLRRRKA